MIDVPWSSCAAILLDVCHLESRLLRFQHDHNIWVFVTSQKVPEFDVLVGIIVPYNTGGR